MDAQAYNQGRCVRGGTNLKLHSKTLMIWKHCFPASLLHIPLWWYVAHCNIVLGLWACFDDLLHRHIFSCACIVVSCVWTQGAIGFKATFHKKTLALNLKGTNMVTAAGGPSLDIFIFSSSLTNLDVLKINEWYSDVTLLFSKWCFASDSSIMYIYIFKY